MAPCKTPTSGGIDSCIVATIRCTSINFETSPRASTTVAPDSRICAIKARLCSSRGPLRLIKTRERAPCSTIDLANSKQKPLAPPVIKYVPSARYLFLGLEVGPTVTLGSRNVRTFLPICFPCAMYRKASVHWLIGNIL